MKRPDITPGRRRLDSKSCSLALVESRSSQVDETKRRGGLRCNTRWGGNGVIFGGSCGSWSLSWPPTAGESATCESPSLLWIFNLEANRILTSVLTPESSPFFCSVCPRVTRRARQDMVFTPQSCVDPSQPPARRTALPPARCLLPVRPVTRRHPTEETTVRTFRQACVAVSSAGCYMGSGSVIGLIAERDRGVQVGNGTTFCDSASARAIFQTLVLNRQDGGDGEGLVHGDVVQCGEALRGRKAKRIHKCPARRRCPLARKSRGLRLVARALRLRFRPGS